MQLLKKIAEVIFKDKNEKNKKEIKPQDTPPQNINYKKRNPNYYKMQAQNKKKGYLYERQISKMLKEEYRYNEVFINGMQYGKLDDGIDIIAKSPSEILLIQCKNWEKSKIEIRILKEFIANAVIYIEKNLKNEKRKIRKIFITSNTYSIKEDKLLEKYINENKEFFEYRVIEYKKEFKQ